ncbi:hypothetical protein NQZ68_008853 [Dissostichus eleginoides]|nr:hypothetical protein NQZ68_008853 [Dissostichus eleginoides]
MSKPVLNPKSSHRKILVGCATYESNKKMLYVGIDMAGEKDTSILPGDRRLLSVCLLRRPVLQKQNSESRGPRVPSGWGRHRVSNTGGLSGALLHRPPPASASLPQIASTFKPAADTLPLT